MLDPSHRWLTIHESVGHPLELDRVLGYEANYAGTSFATLDKWQSKNFAYGSKEVTLVAELARANATVDQLLAMKTGDFIELERESRIQASVDGVPIFECQYGTHNSKYAIRIDRGL